MTINEAIQALKAYCERTGDNLRLPNNASEIVEVGYWVRGDYGIGRKFAKDADGWYGNGETLPFRFYFHLEEDDELLDALAYALKEREEGTKEDGK